MTHLLSVRKPAQLAPPSSPPPSSTRRLLIFAVTAVGVGGALLAISTLVQPDAPFLIAAVLFGLAVPALVLTHHEAGAAGVRALLRDCVRLPSRWWWLPLAAFGLPVLTWAVGAALGGARPVTWGLVALYVVDLVTGALIINIWEEMAWTGYFQRRAGSQWGVVGGSLVTAAFFTGIHVPLAVSGAHGPGDVITGLLYLAGAAVALRLLIARVDAWSGRSLLVVGILHSAFNASESALEPELSWVRVVVVIALGFGVVVGGKLQSVLGPRMGEAQPH